MSFDLTLNCADRTGTVVSLVEAVAVESLQSGPTLCDPMDCNLPVSSAHGFPRQEYWNGLSFPIPGDLPHPGIKPMSFALSGRFFTTEPPEKPLDWRMLIKSSLSG